MEDDILTSIKGLVPTPTGCGVFLNHEDKTIAIFVDHSVAAAITMFLHGVKKPRPLTHDLIANLLAGLGAQIQKVVIHDVEEETFYARIYVYQESEIGKSLIEIDARPSDAIAMALQQGCPIYVSPSVWEKTEDMTWALEQAIQEDGESDDTDLFSDGDS